MRGLRPTELTSPRFFIRLVERLLDVPCSFLQFPLDLLRCSFDLLSFVASDLASLLLDFSCDVLRRAFNLISVR